MRRTASAPDTVVVHDPTLPGFSHGRELYPHAYLAYVMRGTAMHSAATGPVSALMPRKKSAPAARSGNALAIPVAENRGHTIGKSATKTRQERQHSLIDLTQSAGRHMPDRRIDPGNNRQPAATAP